MFSLGLKEHQKRQEETNSFFSSITEAREENKNQGVKCIHEYSEHKKKVMNKEYLSEIMRSTYLAFHRVKCKNEHIISVEC